MVEGGAILSNMIRLTGLWLNESKSGDKYFSGNIGAAKLLIFKNTRKEADNQPDYIAYVAEAKRDDAGGQAAGEDTPF